MTCFLAIVFILSSLTFPSLTLFADTISYSDNNIQMLSDTEDELEITIDEKSTGLSNTIHYDNLTKISGVIYGNFGEAHPFVVNSSGVWIDELLIIENVSVSPNEENLYSFGYTMPFAERWIKFNVFRTRQSYYDAIADIGLSAILALIPGWQGAAYTLYTTFGKTELYIRDSSIS